MAEIREEIKVVLQKLDFEMTQMILSGNYKRNKDLLNRAIEIGFIQVVGQVGHEWYNLPYFVWCAAQLWRLAHPEHKELIQYKPPFWDK